VLAGSNVSLEALGNGRYRLTITGEDHTIGNLLSRTLLSMDEVAFAYYEQPHPLEDRIVVYLQLKEPDGDPVVVLLRALDRILEVNEEFKRLYLEALRDKGLEVED
jgi:DNA-directed RNA polymerase II subunit RPB11/DNA-directed RNA polymerase subunit L